jgi:hypothetical protein
MASTRISIRLSGPERIAHAHQLRKAIVDGRVTGAFDPSRWLGGLRLRAVKLTRCDGANHRL